MLPYEVYPTCVEQQFEVGTFHSSQVAGIGPSQSKEKKATTNKKNKNSKYVFNATVTHSQQRMLHQDFGWLDDDDDDNDDDDSFMDDTSEEEEEEDGGDGVGGDGYIEYPTITLMKQVYGTTCSSKLQGTTERVESSLQSRTLVNVLKRCRREEEEEDEEEEEVEVGEEEGLPAPPSKKKKKKKRDQEELVGYGNLYAAAARQVNEEEEGEYEEYGACNEGANNNDGADNDGFEYDGDFGIAHGRQLHGSHEEDKVVLVVEEEEEEEEPPKKRNRKKRENIMILSNSQDDDEEEEEAEAAAAAASAKPAKPPSFAIPASSAATKQTKATKATKEPAAKKEVVYTRGQRVELYDSGTWWDGKIASRSRKQPRKGRFQHRREKARWVYMVESVRTDMNSVSQDAWAVYDVESTSLRVSLPTFHRTLQGLGREVREVPERCGRRKRIQRTAVDWRYPNHLLLPFLWRKRKRKKFAAVVNPPPLPPLPPLPPPSFHHRQTKHGRKENDCGPPWTTTAKTKRKAKTAS